MMNIRETSHQKLRISENVIKAIVDVWTFLKDHIEFTNTHGAEFISDKHWETFVLPTIQSALLSMSRDELISLPLGFRHEECQDNDFQNLIKAAISCHLENLHILGSLPETSKHSFKDVVAESMSEKKLHEVKIMANTVAGMVRSCDCNDLVVDVGSGKGYLSLELAGHHHLNVLGLDSCQGNTHGAQHRKERLNSRWATLVAKTDNNSAAVKASEMKPADCDSKTNKGDKISDRYIPVTQFVTPDMNLSSILSQHAMSFCHQHGPDQVKAVIAGLHTCGSLAVSAMKLFITDPRAVGLCLVGCCYHLMEEESCDIDETDIHFPLSEFGKSLELRLGRNARNLASQSVHRVAESGQLQGEEFYWRALLDVMIQKLNIPHPERITGIRGLNKRMTTFGDYARKAFEKLGFSLDLLTPEFISEIERMYEPEQAKMAAYFQLKLSLAPAIESLILLDRLMFLLEQPCVQEARLVRLFEPVASPRCYAILSSKTINTANG